jgi:hypothetical protein
MAPRANWKGYLRLSLVSCPIALYPASSLSEKVSFNRLNRKTGNRLKQQNVDSETGEVVPREDIARGYEVAKGQYLIVEDEELDAVQIESTRTIDIDQFVPKSEIDERYIDSPYYIAPDGQVGQDAFAVIRDTIGKLDMVALALLWQILGGAGFPNQFFCDSWVVGFWRGRPWLPERWIGGMSLGVGSSRFWLAWATRRGDRCVRSTCRV